MAGLTYFRCPRSATEVWVPFCPDPKGDPNVYEYVACPACKRSHLVNQSTGELLGDTTKASVAPDRSRDTT